MPSKYEVFTLEDNLVLTNKELTSNVSKFASLIYSYEKIEWAKALKKASEHLKAGTAFEYIDAIRQSVKEGSEPKEVPIQKVKPVFVPKIQKTIFEKNYERLLKVAPEFEERLLEAKKNGESTVYGKSRQSGYMDFSFDMLRYDKTGFYVAIAHYYTQNGDMIPDPDMVVLINITNKTVEALTIQNSMYYIQVYDDMYSRKLVNEKERNSQNRFLAQWLRNLKEQDHKIVWRETEEEQEEIESELIDEYSKKIESNTTEEEVKPEKQEIQEEIEKGETKTIEPEPMEKESRKKSESELNRLASLIAVVENVNDILAKNKAEELIRDDEETKYILDKTDFLKKRHQKKIFLSNYKKLILLFPDLLTRFESDETRELVYSQKSESSTRYELIKGVNLKNGTQQFFFYQFRKDGSKQGTLAIGVHDKEKTVKVLIISESFRFQSDFSDIENDLVTEEKYSVNEWLDEWLLSLMEKDYGFKQESKISEVTEITEPKTEVPEQTPEQIKAETLEAYKENAKKIPDFEIGKVEFTEAHKKAGITKRVINWINKHQRGLTLKPKNKMTFNTKNPLVDLLHHAQKPGMRISRTGKIYYEGRSNRSDLTDTGL